MKNTVLTVAALSAVSFASSAMAQFVTPDGVNYPWVRGTTPGSVYAQWESFTSRSGPNAPDAGLTVVGLVAPDAQPFNFFDTGTTSTVLGTGNLYSGFGQMFANVTVPSFNWAGGTTTLLLQVRTQGTEINGASVNVGGVAPTSVTELGRISLGQQGAQVDTLYRFDLPSGFSTYTVRFDSQMQFFSVDRIAVDAYTVPTPGAGVLLGLAGFAAVRRRRA